VSAQSKTWSSFPYWHIWSKKETTLSLATKKTDLLCSQSIDFKNCNCIKGMCVSVSTLYQVEMLTCMFRGPYWVANKFCILKGSMIEYKVVSVMSKMQRTVASVINMCIIGFFKGILPHHGMSDMYFSQSSQSYSTSHCIYSSKIVW
jgi:hypothetical protein